MLIEVKAKVKVIDGNKTKSRTDTFIVDKEFFSEAEYRVTELINENIEADTVESFEIQSLRIAPIKEVFINYTGAYPFTVTLTDTFVDDSGNEKLLKYKVLLWADELSEAYARAQEIVSQGYDMHIKSIKETQLVYLENERQYQVIP